VGECPCRALSLSFHGRRTYGPGATGVGRCDEVRVVRHVWVAADLAVVMYGPNGREAVIDPSHRVRDFPPGQSLLAGNGVGAGVGEHVHYLERTT
jgi:hypothetical protein